MQMTRDWIVLIGLVVTFATLVTSHVTLTIHLARSRPRWRAPVAFFVAPLTPWWGWHERARIRVVVWVLAAVGYAITWVFVRR
jgi:hypothetical protein